MGGALSSSAIMGVLNGCQADERRDWQPVFLSAEQVNIVAEAAERILPAGETPGARELLVHRFADIMLYEYYLKANQNAFLSGLKSLNEAATNTYGKPFIECLPEEQDKLIGDTAADAEKEMESREDLVKTPETVREGLEERTNEIEDMPLPFFNILKEITLLGYFTSETGASKVLNYDPVPGGFKGCEDLTDLGDKTWAT